MASDNSENRREGEPRPKFSNREYLGFATYARCEDGQWRMRFNWRRIVLVLCALGAAAYLSLALLLFCWFRYKHEWERTSYAQMLVYPFSRETRASLRREIGDKIIADAKVEFQKDRDFGTYFQKIRAGLIYSPNNPDGLIDFSSLLFFQKRTREAFELLNGSLPYALNHASYVQFYVRQSLELIRDEELLDAAETFLPLFPLAEKTLPAPNALKDNHLILTIGAAQACLLRGNFTRAEEILREHGVGETLSGRVLGAQLAWERGRRDEAIGILRETLRLAPGNEQISILYALYLKEVGEVSVARDVLMRLALIKNDPSLRIRVLSLFPGDENKAYRSRLENDYFSRYGENSAALVSLAQYATDNKNFELGEKIYAHAQEKALIDLPKFELLHLELLVLNGKSAEALKVIDELEKGNYAWVKNYRSVIDCLRALAYFSTNQVNLGRINVERALKDNTLPVARLVVLARRLSELGYEEEARSIYENAYLQENNNQAVLLELVNYALDHEDVAMLNRYLPPLLETRRPPRSVLEKVRRFLGSDRMLFAVTRENFIAEISEMLDGEGPGSDAAAQGNPASLESWF